MGCVFTKKLFLKMDGEIWKGTWNTVNLHEMKGFLTTEGKKIGGLVAKEKLLLRDEFRWGASGVFLRW